MPDVLLRQYQKTPKELFQVSKMGIKEVSKF
jgi:hypothetical protein